MRRYREVRTGFVICDNPAWDGGSLLGGRFERRFTYQFDLMILSGTLSVGCFHGSPFVVGGFAQHGRNVERRAFFDAIDRAKCGD
jgi:hypothetical protein